MRRTVVAAPSPWTSGEALGGAGARQGIPASHVDGRAPTAALRRPLLQQPGEPAVLEDAAVRLVLRAVRHDVVLVEDRLEHGAAARARLALVRVDLRRLRVLLGQREIDLLLV